MADGNEMIRVRITATQRVRYAAVKTMTRYEWEQLKWLPENEMEDEGGPLSSWLDTTLDINGADEFEDISLAVVDDAGKVVKPVDEWEGV